MNRSVLFRFAALLALVAFAQLACYKSYTISTEELERLQSGFIAESVEMQTDAGAVEVRATTPVTLLTADGENPRVSPFNFTMNDRNLIAPDYDLLIQRQDITGAEVQEFSRGRTIGVIVGSVLAAGAAFALVSVFAPDEEGI